MYVDDECFVFNYILSIWAMVKLHSNGKCGYKLSIYVCLELAKKMPVIYMFPLFAEIETMSDNTIEAEYVDYENEQ